MVTFFLIALSINLFAQDATIQNHGVPWKTPNSVLYGTDVLIDYQPTENQRGACLSVAFNGWLYACYTVNNTATTKWTIFRSTDDGETWSVFYDQPLNTNWYTQSIDIVVTGNSEPELKVFVAAAYQNDVGNYTELQISRHNGVTGAYEAPIWTDVQSTGEKFKDVAIASDYLFPAVDAAPYSLGIIYSKYQSSADSVRVLTSSDGGMTIDGNQLVTSTGYYVRNVSIAYARSFLWFNGRYFAAWEARAGSGDDFGQIYTAYSDNKFYLPFTTPQRLDDLAGAPSTNFSRNPTVACQFNDIDNTMSNLTAVVLFDRAYNGSLTDYDIVGCYNREAIGTANWAPLYIDNVVNMAIQPHLNFDPGYNNFLLTYADITLQRLRYLVTYQELPDPDNWLAITDKYNDQDNLVNPYPQVEINPMYTQTAHLWSGDVSGNGVATFDAEYSTLGTKEPAPASMSVSVYPNPASTQATFMLDLPEQADLTLQIFTLQGKEVIRIDQGNVTPGPMSVQADVSALPDGCYLYRISAGNKTGSGRLVVQE